MIFITITKNITHRFIYGFIYGLIYVLCFLCVFTSVSFAGNNINHKTSQKTSKNKYTKKQLEIINLKKIANNKNPKALYALGRLYEPDYKKSYPLILRSAKLGYTQAESLVALYYLQGKGVAKNMKQAMIFLHRASKKHDPTANIGLAIISIDKKDNAQAIKLLSVKSLAQNPTALQILGELYFKDKTLENNVKYGIEYFTRSALLFNQEAIYFLAINYYQGKYTPIDYKRASAWAAVLYDLGEKKKATAILQGAFKHMSKKDIQIAQIFSNRIVKEMHKLSLEKH